MKAYCIFDVRDITDPEKVGSYSSQVLQTVQAFGGRYLNVGGNCETVEGEWTPNFLVLLEFPSIDAAHGWYRSAEYESIKPLRLEGALCDAVIIEPQQSDLREQLVREDVAK